MRRFDGFTKGINFGGWLSQYDVSSEEHFDTFITESDVIRAASFGIDHVRVPVNYEIFEDDEGNERPEGYRYIDNCYEWCRKYSLNLVLDLHRTFGYTFDPLDSFQDKEIFFHDERLQDRFFALWERIAMRYGKHPKHLAFELLNEIVSENVIEEWNEIAWKAIKVIRKYAPDSWIIIGGVGNNHVLHVSDLYPPADSHIVYNFHCYDPLLFTHQRAYWVDGMPSDIVVNYPDAVAHYIEQSYFLKKADQDALKKISVEEFGVGYFEELFAPAIEAAEQNDAPLYCGEYGVIDRAPLPDTLNWLRDIHAVFERHSISRALWNYKEKDFGLIGKHYDAIWEEMTQYL